MIDYSLASGFTNDSIPKHFKITATDGVHTVTITNAELVAQSLSLEESICSDDQLTFGRCEAACLKFTWAGSTSLKGYTLAVDIYIGDDTEDPFRLGTYRVESDVPSTDRIFRSVTAYDALYDIINADVTDWYKGFWEIRAKSTIKNFRDSFFAYLGITQEPVELCNDSHVIYKALEGDAISGATIVEAICEINGAFGKITRSGVFRYVLLGSEMPTAPAVNISTDYEDYYSPAIDKVVIRTAEGGADVIVGDGNNVLYVNDNALVADQGTQTLTIAGQALLETVAAVMPYHPIEADVNGNPCFETGDRVSVIGARGSVTSYILHRVLKGVQGLRDTYTSQGYAMRRENLNSLSAQLSSAGQKAIAQEVIAHTAENHTAYSLGESRQKVLSLEFAATRQATVEIWHEILLDVTKDEEAEAAVCTVTYNFDGEDLAYHPEETWSEDGKHLLVLHYYIRDLAAYLTHTWQVWLTIAGGTAELAEECMHSMLSGQGLVRTIDWDGAIVIEEMLEPTPILPLIDIDGISDTVGLDLTDPHWITIGEEVGSVAVGMITVDRTGLAERVTFLMQTLVFGRVTEAGDQRVTEDGNRRTTEEED